MKQRTIEYDENGRASVTAYGRSVGVSVAWVTNARNSGGTYADDGIDYPFRIVLHEIQGSSNPSMIAGHPYPPHIWYNPETRTLYQTVNLGRSSFALYQAANAPYKTNKARALQVELAGYSDYVANEPRAWLNNIAEDVVAPMCSWVATQGHSIDLSNIPPPWKIPGSAYPDAPQRFQPTEWAKFNGLCAHANVPMGDDHWDTGAMDLWWIAEHASYLIAAELVEAGLVPTQKEKLPMPEYLLHRHIPGTGGSYFAVYADGYVRTDLTWTEINYFINKKNLDVLSLQPADVDKIHRDRLLNIVDTETV